MLTKSPSDSAQTSFFDIINQLDDVHPVLALSHAIDWYLLEQEFAHLYSSKGRRAKPIRLMTGLLIFKQLYDLSDEAVEPIIGHLKQDYRLSRNWLKGDEGDAINLLMAACVWNLREWMSIFFLFEAFSSW